MGIDRALFAKGKVPEYLICPCCKDVLDRPYEICQQAHLICASCRPDLFGTSQDEDEDAEAEEWEPEPPKTLAETAPGLEQEFASQAHSAEREESDTPAPENVTGQDEDEEEDSGGGTGSDGEDEDDDLQADGTQKCLGVREGDGKGPGACPVCEEPLLDMAEVRGAKAVDRIIHELTVNCAHLSFGCLWTGILRDQPEHDETCEYRPIPCIHADQGCGFSGPRDTHMKHEERDCPFATALSRLYPVRGRTASGLDLKAHEVECDAFECETPGCPTMSTKRMMPAHQLACTEYTRLYKRAMRNIKKLKNELEKARNPTSSTSRPVAEITLDDNDNSPMPTAPTKRSTEVYIKTESPLKRPRVNGPADEDEQMQEGSQPALDAAAAGAGPDDEEEDLPSMMMQRFRPLFTALPILRTRAQPPSALPFLRFTSSSPSPSPDLSLATTAPAESDFASGSSKAPSGGFSKPKKEGSEPNLTYFVPRTANGELHLQRHIARFIPESHPFIRPAAGAIVLRGNWAREVKEFLWAKGF
ncbi:54S ribosomal protein img2, mitochondrial [Rhodotorula toruloides]